MSKASEGSIESREAWERRFALAGPSSRVWMCAAQEDPVGLRDALADGGRLDFIGPRGVGAWGELCGFSGLVSLFGERRECLAALIEAGADVNERRRSDGSSALHAAARGWGEAETRLLIEAGARLEGQDRSGATPLIAGARAPRSGLSGDPEAEPVFRALLDAGARLDAVDVEGKTALMWAAEAGRDWLGALLLERGADWRIKSRSGKTALDLRRLRSIGEEAPGSGLLARLTALSESELLANAASLAKTGKGKAL